MPKKGDTKIIKIDDLINKDDTYQFYVPSSQDYVLKYRTSELEGVGSEFSKTINFVFTKPNTSSNLEIRIVADSPGKTSLKIVVVTPKGVTGVQSTLKMNALMINENAQIEFIPSLEIDERDVSVDHKSTIGVPDEAILWYMKSRGLSQKECIEMLVEGFFN